MDRRFLAYYNRELQHIREMGGEFAKEFPKIAGRLGLEGFECADPYVERLLEGLGFLAARIQLKIDAQFPRFTQHLLESVYPAYVAPMPSMAVVQFEPDPAEGTLLSGIPVARGTILRSTLGKGEQTACEYRTAHDVTLWPIEVAQVEYFRYGGASVAIDVPSFPGVRAGLRLRIRTTGGLRFEQLALDSLTLFLRGGEDLPMRVYEQLHANTVAVVARPTRLPAAWHEVIPREKVRRVGFDDNEALLPQGPRQFSGHRLINEYFAFPQRFLFAEIAGLGRAVRRTPEAELDVLVLFDRAEPTLENVLDPSNFALFCSPAINLFPKKVDRIHLSNREFEYHVVPDRTRPMDFEVYQVLEVQGFGAGGEREQDFLPFYETSDLTRHEDHRAFFTVFRQPRRLSEKQAEIGPRSSYIGTEVFLSLVDADDAPYRSELKQLSVGTLCTNRDLPLQMPTGQGRTDFTATAGAPARSIRCVAGPTKPRAALADGEAAWRLISHLSSNYLSIVDADERQGATALREIMSLYADTGEASIRKQIDGIRSVSSAPIIRRVPARGPIAYGRGLEVRLTLEETAFQGLGAFLLGAVAEQFFTRYVSLNSFVETVVRTTERGEIIRWPARIGRRQIC